MAGTARQKQGKRRGVPATSPVTPGTALIEMVRGYQISRAIHAAASLRLADHLADGPRSSEDLANKTGAHAGALRRLLRVLVSRGILEQHDEDRYELTATSQLMRSDVPGSVLGQLLLWGHPMQWVPWGAMLHSVYTGEPAFDQVFGTGHWDYLERHPDAGEMFKKAMAAHPSHVEVPRAYDFSDVHRVVDIGGGSGQLIAEILRLNPSMRAVLLDRPSVIAGAEAVLQAAGVAERCRALGGDFFSDLPRGADAYILSNVLMDWDDAAAKCLLGCCHDAIRAGKGGGRLIVIERTIPADNAPSLSQLGDLMGLVITGGRIRSDTEFDTLLAATGFHVAKRAVTESGYSILDARPTP